MTLPFGIDISRWNYSSDGTQKPDFDAVNATCDFVGAPTRTYAIRQSSAEELNE